jgi:hypothetical protein
MDTSIQSRSYPVSVDQNGKKYDMFACTGNKSLGTFPVYGDSTFDPCKRKDSDFPRNEFQPGEQMVLRMDSTMVLRMDSTSTVSYDPGSIVEVATGADVTF